MRFDESTVEADGFGVRCLQAGEGRPLLVMHAARGVRLTRTHELLAGRRRVIVLEAPGFGVSPVNRRTRDLPELAGTMIAAARALGLDRFALMGESFGAKLALWMATQAPDAVEALVLAAPSAIRPDTSVDTAEQDGVDPEIAAKQAALAARLFGPPVDGPLEALMPAIAAPTLALFGQRDARVPTRLARRYRQLMPACNLVFVYDAGHGLTEERPEAAAAVIADFLEQPAAFLVNRQDGMLSP